MDIIRVAEMLAIMEMHDEGGEPIPFSIRFITANRNERTGGRRITCSRGVLVGGQVSQSTRRNPNHYVNYTRNVRFLPSEEIRKVHPLLVEEFNGSKVIF